MKIDFHTHCFPQSIASNALNSLSAGSGNMKYFTDGTKEGIIKALDKANIDKAVVLNIATNPLKQSKINDAALKLNDERIVGFGSIHPDAPDCIEELERISQMGIKGIKLHPEYQNFNVDEPRLFKIYEKIGSLGLITVFHAGLDNAYLPPAKCSPKALKKILPYFGGAPVVAAHTGSYMMWEDVLNILCGENIYFDTSFCHSRIPKPLFEAIVKKHGANKILFGSDSPWADMQEEEKLISSIDISQNEFELIMGGNAARLLERL